MPSGWNTYYVFFLSAALALFIPASLRLIGAFLAQKQARPSEEFPSLKISATVERDLSLLGRRINTRFFSGTNAALLLIALGLFLIPCAVTLHAADSEVARISGLVSILSLTAVLILGLLYAAKKGDLMWLSSYPTQPKDKPPETKKE